MPNKDGARCLHTAAQAGHVGVVNTILAKGEHVDVTTNVRHSQKGLFKLSPALRDVHDRSLDAFQLESDIAVLNVIYTA